MDNEYFREYREKNRESINLNAVKRYHENIQKHRERAKKYYHANKVLVVKNLCPGCGKHMRKFVYFNDIMVHKGKCKQLLAHKIVEGLYI